jgi:hypothetical protein
MKRRAFAIRLIVAAVMASLRVIVRRASRGPTLPTWRWSEEFLVAISRAALIVGARNLALMSPRRGGPNVPHGREARAALTVEDVQLRGVLAERYRPKTAASGTILYFHGGGFVTGSVAMERRPAAAQAMLRPVKRSASTTAWRPSTRSRRRSTTRLMSTGRSSSETPIPRPRSSSAGPLAPAWR